MSSSATSIAPSRGAGISSGRSARTTSKWRVRQSIGRTWEERTGSSNGHARFGFVDHVLHHVLEIPGLLEDAQLTVGSGAPPNDLVHVAHLVGRAELSHHVVHKFQQLDH